jgi:hypothetical protein
MKVKSLMASDVKCCAIHDTLSTAAQIMWDNDVGVFAVWSPTGTFAWRHICAGFCSQVQRSRRP